MKKTLLALLLTLPALGQTPDFLLQTQRLITSVSDRVKPTVVHIESWSRRAGTRVKALGSGVVVTAEGKIVTNYHVIDKADQVQVVLDDRSRYDAVILQRDKLTDLAVLQIQAPHPLPFATLADSEKVQVGQWVLAVGNPYGLDRTVSFGIISGKGRYIPGSEQGLTPLNDFLQTDANIDSGSSGGPLVDLQGQVVGINSSGIGRGIGFTIPAKVVKEVMQGKVQQGQLERGWLGLYTQPFTRSLAAYRGMTNVRGLLVSDFASGSPAAKSGLLVGDVITEIDGSPVEAEEEDEIQRFAQQVSRLTPGSKTEVKVRRGTATVVLAVEVGLQPHLEGAEVETPYGFRVAEITNYRQQQFRLTEKTGVVVTEVLDGSAASEAGVEEGDLLLEWEDRPVESLAQVEKLADAPAKPSLLLRFRKGQYRYFALLQQRGRKKT
ncbi:MAG: trypsin-like peptidase domain-containing protein [Candidatus Eremiobacteraeota bacterium]|nr:trypsin-like peptidase domain-containing protein [Candidatus Eremiobacteraeota bacterium]